MFQSGRIVTKELQSCIKSSGLLTHVDVAAIEAPEPLKEEYDSNIDLEVEVDGPTLCVSRDGDIIVEMRHVVLTIFLLKRSNFLT